MEHEFDGRRCRVTVGAGALDEVGALLGSRRRGGRALIVSDTNVGPLYAGTVAESLRTAGVGCDIEIVPVGEASKSLDRLSALYDRLASIRLGRDGLLVAVGGGVVSDLAGFAAATWLRGVDFAICPTSLEAAVDASIGGKTGVNHPSGKNLIGAFHQPKDVIIDPACLHTLPERDRIAGLAESIKHALIADGEFADWHEAHRDGIVGGDPETMEALIARNVAIKADVVGRDARERSGVRARLNFGHTIGHAIEASCEHALRHGECVALGMIAATRLSRALELLPDEACRRVESLVASFGLPIRHDRVASYATLATYMASDKKRTATRLRWVLLSGIGATVIRDDIPVAAVQATVESLG